MASRLMHQISHNELWHTRMSSPLSRNIIFYWRWHIAAIFSVFFSRSYSDNPNESQVAVLTLCNKDISPQIYLFKESRCYFNGGGYVSLNSVWKCVMALAIARDVKIFDNNTQDLGIKTIFSRRPMLLGTESQKRPSMHSKFCWEPHL